MKKVPKPIQLSSEQKFEALRGFARRTYTDHEARQIARVYREHPPTLNMVDEHFAKIREFNPEKNHECHHEYNPTVQQFFTRYLYELYATALREAIKDAWEAAGLHRMPFLKGVNMWNGEAFIVHDDLVCLNPGKLLYFKKKKYASLYIWSMDDFFNSLPEIPMWRLSDPK